jgi:hypothetical protein
VTRESHLASPHRKFIFFIIKGMKSSTLHTLMTLVWVVLILPTLLWWRESVLWVALMSLWANIAAHWGAREAAKAKERSTEGGTEH